MTPSAELRRLCSELENQEIKRSAFLRRCVRLVASELGCSRAGIWMFEGGNEQRRLTCLAMFDRARGRLTRVPSESGPQVATYFAALENAGFVVADDARGHPATAGFFEDHLGVSGVRSLLAVAFSVNGRRLGAFTCTQVGGTLAWTPQQLAGLRAIAGRVSLAIANAERHESETQPALLVN
jgi:GAF domain-containing protein